MKETAELPRKSDMKTGSTEHGSNVTGVRRTRIAFVESNPFPKYSGGIETWLFHLITKLDEQKREVIVFAPPSPSTPFYDVSHLRRLKLIEVPPIRHNEKLYAKLKSFIPGLSFLPITLAYITWPFKAWLVIRKHVKRQDTIVALHIIPSMLPLIVYKCCGGRSRVLCSVRGTMGTILKEMNKSRLAWLYCATERMLLRFANIVISNGEDTSAYLMKELHRHAIVVPNGVDFEWFSQNLTQSPLREQIAQIENLNALKRQGASIILILGTLRDAKGIRFVLEAAAHLHRDLIQLFCLCFVGKGDPTPYYRYAGELGVAENLLFAGEQKEILPFIRAADIGVVVSGGGGVSHALLEMMAAGLPVVAWNNLTYSQVLVHGVSGHLVESKDSLALANGIKSLIQHAEYRRSLAQNARRVAAEHDWRVVVRRFLEVVDCPST